MWKQKLEAAYFSGSRKGSGKNFTASGISDLDIFSMLLSDADPSTTDEDDDENNKGKQNNKYHGMFLMLTDLSPSQCHKPFNHLL